MSNLDMLENLQIAAFLANNPIDKRSQHFFRAFEQKYQQNARVSDKKRTMKISKDADKSYPAKNSLVKRY